ncbi:MAG TPA: YihY/virulence factor BrkB family protein, partial [Gammaproteobacteria bacterium]|nr:YihY/virulence factor BrkB family protein [Gammaproteobacteria bacterium]
MIEQYWEGLKLLLWNSVWAVNVATLPPTRAYAVRAARVCHTLVREFIDGELNQRAASLVFTTLLSLVPLLAVSFSVLKAFGVHNDLEQVLIGFLAPLGDKGIELGARIMDFVDNVNGRVLGGIGLTLLMLTVLSLVHKIERSFNYIWRVERPRGFIERFSGYLSALLVGPVLIFTALGLTASIMGTSLMQSVIAIEPLGAIIKWLVSMIPYMLVIAAFTLVYIFIPNTRVKVRAAFVGAVIAGILWQSAGWSFASFVANSPKHAAIYSSFAVAFLFMIWLYVAWLILLVGATVAFFIQHPEYHGMPDRMITLSNRMREKLAMLAVFRIAQHHVHGKPPVSVSRLSLQLGVPVA